MVEGTLLFLSSIILYYCFLEVTGSFNQPLLLVVTSSSRRSNNPPDKKNAPKVPCMANFSDTFDMPSLDEQWVWKKERRALIGPL